MEIVHLTKENFSSEVVEYKGKVLIDFFATWCAPCRMLSPVLESLVDEVDVKICKVNVDQESELALEFKVSSIPLLVLMENGKVIGSRLGYLEREEILDFIK